MSFVVRTQPKYAMSKAASGLLLFCVNRPVPTTSGRSLNWLKPLKSAELLNTVKGVPDCVETIAEICQPPNAWRFTPLFQPRRR